MTNFDDFFLDWRRVLLARTDAKFCQRSGSRFVRISVKVKVAAALAQVLRRLGDDILID